MLSHVNLQSLYGAGPICLHFLHEEQEHTRGSWNLCELLCPDSKESLDLEQIRWAGGYLHGWKVHGSERKGKQEMEREVSREWGAGMEFGVSWGLPSSPCQNSGAQPGSTDKSLSPAPGSPKMSMWSQQSLAPGVWIREECVPAGSSVASLAQVAFIQVSTLATPQTGRWGRYFD